MALPSQPENQGLYLHEIGLRPHHVNEDGNCLFQVLSFAIVVNDSIAFDVTIRCASQWFTQKMPNLVWLITGLPLNNLPKK